MAMHVQWPRSSSGFLPSPVVLQVWLCCCYCCYCLLLAPCLTAAASRAAGGGPQTTATAQDLLRTKLALAPSTTNTNTLSAFPSSSSSSSSSSHGVMDGGSRGQGRGLRDVLQPFTTATGAAMMSADVSDDEDLTLGSGSGFELPDTDARASSAQSPLHHTLQDDRNSRLQSTCCFVGKVAASRHLHCLAQYHVDKLSMRRSPLLTPHRRQGARYQPHSKVPKNWSRDFRRCVLQRPLVFEKCCYGYATTRSDRLRWYNHRKARTGSLHNTYHSWRYV